MVDRKFPELVHFECPHHSNCSDPNLVYFRDNLGTLQTHSKYPQFCSFPEMCLQCSQIIPKIYRVGITVVRMMWTFKMYQLGKFSVHHSGSFWILLTQNTAIKLMGTLQGTLWMGHLGTSQVLSLGNFKMNPLLSYLGHPGTLWMYWLFSVNEPLRHTAVFFLGKFKMYPWIT